MTNFSLDPPIKLMGNSGSLMQYQDFRSRADKFKCSIRTVSFSHLFNS